MTFHRIQFYVLISFILAVSSLLCSITSCFADEEVSPLEDIKQLQSELRNLSLHDLLDVEVTSVSKKTQKVSDSAAAISVITQDDIKRSSATTLPDVLRLATGLQVGQINGHTWSVSARGFDDAYAAKLLVLIDGRSLYMPDFSGVMWDMQDTVLEDIERIEVIRGSGGTMWGANAVNGVINIITKSSKDTVGNLLSMGAGTTDRVFGSLRYGTALSDNTFMRVYAKGLQQEAFQSSQASIEKLWGRQPPQKGEPSDDWWSQRAGMRIDSDTIGGNHWMLQTEANRIEKSNYDFFTRNADTQSAHTAHILGSLKHDFSDNADFFIQAYYDTVKRDFNVLKIRNDNFDLDFHQRWQFSPQQEFTWGGGYRITLANADEHTKGALATQTLPMFNYNPASVRSSILNLFLQDEIRLRPDLKLTLGSKLEHNDATGWENQPNIRLLWTANPKHSFWSAISRSVRTPSRTERSLDLIYATGYQVNLNASTTVPVLTTIAGTNDIRAEKQLSYELGWRFQVNKQLSLDTAMFFNQYDDLISITYLTPYLDASVPAMIAPVAFKNMGKGRSAGLELNADWQISPQWRIHAGYSYLHNTVSLFPNSSSNPNNSTFFMLGLNAPHQLHLGSYWDFSKNWQWNVSAHWRSRIDRAPNEQMPEASTINAYIALDTRLTWKMNKALEFSLVGKNLLSTQHLDFLSIRTADLLSTEVPRSAYLQMRWEFQ